MINKINSFSDISTYLVENSGSYNLNLVLSNYDEIAWLDRDRGYKEGIVKSANIRGLPLETRRMQIALLPYLMDYLNDKSLNMQWVHDSVFIKFLNGDSYQQLYLNPIFETEVALIYVISEGQQGATINFINKNLSQPMEKGNLFIFPASPENAFTIEGVSSGEMIVSISYITK